MSSESPEPGGSETTAPEKGARNRPTLIVVGVIVAVVLAVYGFNAWAYNSTHVSTDDAQVTSDLVQLSPKVAGTVIKVYVTDNQVVKAGDLIAELDSASYQTAVDQAAANVALARAQSRQAQATVGLTGDLGNAQILQAQGQLDQSQGAVQGSVADVSKFRASETAARAQESSAKSTIASAEAALEGALANAKRADVQVRQAQSEVKSAQADAKAALAGVEGAVATRDKAQHDADRAEALLKEGVVSDQSAEQARTQLSVAQANWDAARQKALSAATVVVQRREEVFTAQIQVDAANAQVAQARAAIRASQDMAVAASAAVAQATAQLQSAATNIQQAQGKSRQARGALQQAKTAPAQLKISQVQGEQAAARLQQAQAALEDAQLKLSWTKIYAPVGGRISKKWVNVGSQVQVGSPLMAIVTSEDPWVVANYKETQLPDVRVGAPAEIEVDALSGKPLKGHVDSIAAGTGATFALLPPDNATGNYTKVVQRIPVKIVLEPGQPGLEHLRVGLSVTASIATKEK